MLTVESHWAFFFVGLGIGLALAVALYLVQRANEA